MSRLHLPYPPLPARERCILITGLPNFIAVQLVRRIVEAEPTASVVAIVRADLRQRTEVSFRQHLPAGARIELLDGDVVDHDLHLSLENADRLRSTVTDIYHLASLYHLGVDKRQAEEVNIQGTRNVLDFAAGCVHLVRVNHFSTAFVAGDRMGVILEEELERGQRFRNTFERTKFTAELEVRRRMRELPITVYRPSLVVGDSRTGEIDRLDGPYFFLQMVVNNPTRVPLPLPSLANHPLNIVPVDYVAAAAHALSLGEEASGKTYHLVDPNPLSLRDAFRMFAEAAGRSAPRGGVPSWLGHRLMSIPMVESWTRNSRAFLHEVDTLTIFNSMHALSDLTGTGVACPPLPSYVARLVRFIRHREQGWHTTGPADEEIGG